MKPKIPNQKKNYRALNTRLGTYMAQVANIYDSICDRLASVVDTVGYDGGAEFLFDDYPELKSTVNSLMADYVGQMNSLIYSGTSSEWKASNLIQDLLARRVLKAYDFERGGDKYNRYFQPNSDALKAFQSRAEKGMNLSAKLWNQSEELKKELECTISTAIDKGQSAVVLSKRLSQYLSDFPSLKADYTEKFGHAVNCRDCQYASMRLARTEINMAYRTAEHERWKQFDFILGFEVKLSKSHPSPDICNDLQGRYPKDFKFVGWHPNCMCYVVPIVMSDEEYYGGGKSPNMVNDVPEGFSQWVKDNRSRIAHAKTQPYFIRDNQKAVEKILKGKEKILKEKEKSKPKTPLTPEQRERRSEIKAEAKKLLHGVEMRNDGFDKPMTISNKAIKEWLNQPFSEFIAKNEALLTLPKLIKEAEYLGRGTDEHDADAKMHLFETLIGHTKSWVIVREMHGGKCVIHSISDQPKILDYLTNKKT